MSPARRVAQVVLSSCAFVFSFLLLLYVAGLLELIPSSIPEPAIPVFLLLAVGLPSALGVWVARRLGRRWATEARRRQRPRWLAWPIVAAYVVTGVFGVPAAISRQNTWAVAEYKRVHGEGPCSVWDCHLPYIWTYGAVPVLPGLIVSYREYQLAGLYGLGAFELTLWYGTGTKSLGELPIWIS